MNIGKWLGVFVALVGINSNLFCVEQEQLKIQDITKIMQQIFDQHIEKKEITKDIFKNALKIYINQFDPYRSYLLESEVHPYLNPSDEELARMIGQYKANNFQTFKDLNNLIQKSIERSRAMRAEFEKNPAPLFLAKQVNPADWGEPNPLEPFARDMAVLKHRTQQQIVAFIFVQKKRYGDALVNQRQGEVIVTYEKFVREMEDGYLYENPQGQPLPANQQENLFALHVLKALASSLDSHTKFYDQNEAYEMKVRLEKALDGVGVILREMPEGFVVVGMVEGSPAAKSGLIKNQDVIDQIDGKKVQGKTFEEVLDILRGKEGTSVALVLKRKGNDWQGDKLVNVTLKREEISLKNDRVDVAYEKFGNGIIGVITLHGFYQSENGISSEKDVKDSIIDLDKKGNLRGLILDLRYNSGGFLTQAVKVAGLFITEGVVVISKYGNGDQKIYRDLDSHLYFDGPLVVLTSRATASAAEIVAQALQDYGVALVVGDERTYGKGTIQTQTVTEAGEQVPSFKVTVGEYFTVSGKTPQDIGVLADVVVPGILSREQIGEEYTEHPIKAQRIAPEYSDPLLDVRPDARAWYVKYYLPSLQKKNDYWRSLLPVLKKNSDYRITHNKNYQLFLKGQNWKADEDGEEDEFTLLKGSQKNFGADDLQMTEAVNVIKDMILLQTQDKSRSTIMSP